MFSLTGTLVIRQHRNQLSVAFRQAQLLFSGGGPPLHVASKHAMNILSIMTNPTQPYAVQSTLGLSRIPLISLWWAIKKQTPATIWASIERMRVNTNMQNWNKIEGITEYIIKEALYQISRWAPEISKWHFTAILYTEINFLQGMVIYSRVREILRMR